VEFRVLGPLEVVADDGAPVPLGGPRRRSLLALLLIDANGVVPVDRLVDGIWGEDPPATAHGALQVHVHALRKALGADRIVTRPPGYVLRVDEEELDAHRFERLVAAGDPGALGEALSLWRGPAFADVAERPFVQSEAARLEESRLAALEARIEADLVEGRHAELTAELEALALEHPHREALQVQRMIALYRSGRQADALAAYRQAREALLQLGLEPSSELRALEQRVLRQDPALAPPAAGLQRPLVAGDRLLGRDLERATLQALLDGGAHRVVTVTGTPGVGKTTLALAVTCITAVVELAAVEDAGLVAGELARALGCVSDPAVPLVELIAERLEQEHGIVVLDNFEQVMAARDLVAALAERAPSARLLVTSRVPLRIAAERELRLTPLEIPRAGEERPDAIAGVPAVELYVARAREAVPGLELTDRNAPAIARIARLLDGLPLAIELAAARVRVLGPEATATRLGEGIAFLRRAAPDRPERQRSVSAAIDWSYRLLEPEHQAWFRSLAALAGGGSLQLVEALREGDATDALDALVDASLVVHHADEDGTPRFSMLQPIREHALALLAAHGEEKDVRDRHLAHVLETAVSADRLRRQDLASYPLDSLRLEVDNLRAALDHAVAERRTTTFARLVCALAIFWTLDEAHEEALARFETAYSTIDDLETDDLRFAVTNGLALFSYFRGDIARALELSVQALGDDPGRLDPGEAGRALRLRSSIANALGRPDEALAALEQAIPLLERAGDRASAARSSFTVAEAHRRAGDLAAAVAAGEHAAEELAVLGDREGEGFAWLVVAAAHLTGGAHDEALGSLRRSLDAAESAGDASTVESAALLRARLAAEQGELGTAALLLGYARAAYEPRGGSRWEIEREYWEPVERALGDAMPAAERDRLIADGAALQPGVVASLIREPVSTARTAAPPAGSSDRAGGAEGLRG
jgi:predicted ATPase/DNA-binding SARP family transcriptional activator